MIKMNNQSDNNNNDKIDKIDWCPGPGARWKKRGNEDECIHYDPNQRTKYVKRRQKMQMKRAAQIATEMKMGLRNKQGKKITAATTEKALQVAEKKAAAARKAAERKVAKMEEATQKAAEKAEKAAEKKATAALKAGHKAAKKAKPKKTASSPALQIRRSARLKQQTQKFRPTM